MDSKTLLLLESDDGNREMIQSIVLDHDLAMQSAYNLEDALRSLGKTKAFAFAFNLELVEGDPLEMVRKLRQEHPELPLLCILDEGRMPMMVELLKAGTYACLNLPLQMEELAFNLSKIIANSTETYNPFS